MSCATPTWIPMSGKNKHLCMLIDEADLALLAGVKWYLSHTGYAVDSKARAAHRLVAGATEYRQQVDHENGRGLDNRRGNLRVATHIQNAQNQRASKNQKAGGFKGVSLVKKNGKWRAAIRYGGRCYRIGEYVAKEDAARAYDAKAREQFGEFAACNFPVAP